MLKYKVHTVGLDDPKVFEDFLNSLEGEIITIMPSGTVEYRSVAYTCRFVVRFVLVVEKLVLGGSR